MSPVLIIVESPSKVKKIDTLFPGKFKAMATYGHICDLPSSPQDGGIGIHRETLEGQYALTQNSKRCIDGKRVITQLQKYLRDHPKTAVYLATEDDREGESIAAFLQSYLKLKNPKRMRYNALTKESIEHAYQTAGHINQNAVAARETRRLIDRIIDYTVSPLLRQIVNKKDTTVSQVQTAIEALVIERERAIRNHYAQHHYTVHFDFEDWQATWQVPEKEKKRTGHKTNSEYDLDNTAAVCHDESVARDMTNHKTLLVSACTETIETRQPPPPFNTNRLIQTANSLFGWEAKKTMRIAQRLYEGENANHGHITYHHTENSNINPRAEEEIRHWLQTNNLPTPETPNTWPSKNNQTQGCEAIRPTHIQTEEAGATEEQRSLYKLIRERAIYSQLAPAKYSAKTIVLTDAVHRTKKFTATARTQIDPGWLATAAAKNPAVTQEEETDETPTIFLPYYSPGEMVNVRGVKIKTHTTLPPPRYTLTTLLTKLEKLGIGTPTTFAEHLKNIQIKGTVTQDKEGNLEATHFGEKCYDALYPKFLFAYIGYAAELEKALNQIANGSLDAKTLARTVWNHLDACAASTT